jgi:glycosyltransferase involved in cell wall biosynthesis
VVGPEDPEKADRLPPEMIEAAAAQGVRFLGMRDDIDHLYAAFDVFVLPSHREGFPRAAMEAAAMGLPVVATDIRGCRQVVEPGVTGLLVPVDDPPALGEALRGLARDSGRRAAMGRAAREKARREFDERDVVRIVLETYAEIAREKGLAFTL